MALRKITTTTRYDGVGWYAMRTGNIVTLYITAFADNDTIPDGWRPKTAMGVLCRTNNYTLVSALIRPDGTISNRGTGEVFRDGTVTYHL